jgi:hypothetical protein
VRRPDKCSRLDASLAPRSRAVFAFATARSRCIVKMAPQSSATRKLLRPFPDYSPRVGYCLPVLFTDSHAGNRSFRLVEERSAPKSTHGNYPLFSARIEPSGFRLGNALQRLNTVCPRHVGTARGQGDFPRRMIGAPGQSEHHQFPVRRVSESLSEGPDNATCFRHRVRGGAFFT